MPKPKNYVELIGNKSDVPIYQIDRKGNDYMYPYPSLNPYYTEERYDWYNAGFPGEYEGYEQKPWERIRLRNPQTGLLLKSPDHPTAREMYYEEVKKGNAIYKDLVSNREYSFPKEQIPTTPFLISKYVPVEPTFAIEDAKRRIKEIENSKNNSKGGWDKSKKVWKAHDSYEGGSPTIAWGFKLSANPEIEKLYNQQGYLTEEQSEQFLDSIVNERANSAKRKFNQMNNDPYAWDQLHEKMQSILIDFEYNGGLNNFPKLVKGVYEQDLPAILTNYKRYSNGKALTGRNKSIKKDIDSLYIQYPIYK